MSTNASHLQCGCGLVREPASLIAAREFPIETEICHCNPCRQTSGALVCTYIGLIGSPTSTSLRACTRYSRRNGRVERYFCSICGTRTFDYTTDNKKWYACSGIVEPDPAQTNKNVVKVTSHKFVVDTGDGGLALLLKKLGGRDLPCFAKGLNVTAPMADNVMAQLLHTDQLERQKVCGERLFGSCHCGSVQFHIRPLISSSTELPQMKGWLSARSKTKYLGLNCACRYCRLCIGFPISTSIYVMPENIVVYDGNGSEKQLFKYKSSQEPKSDFAGRTDGLRSTLPALRFDFSSQGIRRSFCGKCGASAFFERASRPQVVNVAMGILRAESGCLAKDWVDMNWSKMWYKEFSSDHELVEAVEMVGKKEPENQRSLL